MKSLPDRGRPAGIFRFASEPWLMRVAFATAGAGVTAGLMGVLALVSWA